ncbi:MAG: hypothetical protein LAP87_30365 [Acidobacteriia bacterium]|nr:hypothetical protein [Terriglobia bacterium]
MKKVWNRSISAARVWAGAWLFICGLHAATPADYRQRVGVYVWGKLAGGLEAAADDIRRLGADRAVRVSVGPGTSWDPLDTKDNSPLDVKVRRADYRAFLAAFPVVMLTAYDSASAEKYKRVRLDAQHLAATRDEFRRFTLELAKTPGRKIVSNWEFENDCKVEQWASCEEYYQARLDGILEGRKQARAAGSPGEVLSAFEFTIVPGFKGRRSGLVEVATKLKGLDYLSYSSWWSIGWDADAGRVYKDFAFVPALLRDFATSHKLPARLIIGEFGEYWDVHPKAERMRALMNASIDNGVEYLFNWVLYDQPGNKDEWGRDASHFGKYALDRSLTPQGRAFRRWFAAPAPAAPAKSAAGR